MPKNKRPGGLFGDWEYGWQDTTLNERIQAQNQWDLLEAQEEANRIAQQKIDEDKKNTEKIAEAIREVERKYENQEDLEELKSEYYEELEELRLETKNQKKYYKLCSKLDVDYDELEEFYQLLSKGVENSYTRILEEEMIPGYEELIDNGKGMIEYFKSEIRKDKNGYEKIEVTILNEKDVDKAYKELGEDSQAKVSQLQYFINLNDTVVKNKQQEIDANNNVKMSVIQFFVDIPLGFWLIHELFINQSHEKNSLLAAIIFIIFNIICYIDLKKGVKSTNKKLMAEMDEINRDKDKYILQLDKELNKNIAYWNALQKYFENEIDKMKKECEENRKKNSEIKQNLAMEFLLFRLSHYNLEMEELFYKLDFPYLKLMDKLLEKECGPIEKNKKKNGTVNDYIKFIRKTLKKYDDI